MIKKWIRKGYTFLKTVFTYLWIKGRYGCRVRMSLLNAIKGKLRVELDNDGYLIIGKYLMTMGPLNIKVGRKSTLSIGNRCFFNHNASITCNSNIIIGEEYYHLCHIFFRIFYIKNGNVDEYYGQNALYYLTHLFF